MRKKESFPLLLALLLVSSCTLDADPTQRGVPVIVGLPLSSDTQAGDSNSFEGIDRLRILVSGEFGLIQGQASVEDGTFVIEVPPGRARQFQVIGERDDSLTGLPIPVLFGATIADVVVGQDNEITIPAMAAGSLVADLLAEVEGLTSLLLSALTAPDVMPQDYLLDVVNGVVQGLPLPLGVYEIDPLSLAEHGLFLPPGENLIFIEEVGGLVEREIALLQAGVPVALELVLEGLSLRIRVVDALGQTVPFVGSVLLGDLLGLLSLPSLITFTAQDLGEKLLGGILSALPGLTGVTLVTAEAQGNSRLKGSLVIPPLGLLPPGPAQKVVVMAADTSLAGGRRPEPGDLAIAVVDALGTPVTSFSGTVTLSADDLVFLFQEEITIPPGKGFVRLPRALVPKGPAGVVTLTATAPGLQPGSVNITITNP